MQPTVAPATTAPTAPTTPFQLQYTDPGYEMYASNPSPIATPGTDTTTSGTGGGGTANDSAASDSGGGGGGSGGGGGADAGNGPGALPILPTLPGGPDPISLIGDLDKLPLGKVWEMQPRLQRMLALMGDGFRNTFLDILRRMGFKGMGNTGLYGFEADWMTPDSFVLTPEIEALIKSLDAGQIVMMRLVLNDLMDLPATAPTAPTTPTTPSTTTPTDTTGTNTTPVKPEPIATIQPVPSA